MLRLAKGLLTSILLMILILAESHAQEVLSQEIFDKQGGIEVIIDDSSLLMELDKHEGLTIDHGCTHHAPRMYATASGYNYLMEQNIAFTYIERPKVELTMLGPEELPVYRSECMPDMDFYPTYEAYVEMMNNFQSQYPDLCRVFSIGTLESGRQIWMAQLGDDLDDSQDEPNLLYTSTMHGDETTGFPMMLQLIDLLLCNYETDNRIRTLMDEVNIYINPLANPDGTYTNDNSTVQGATRRNANFIDLNRNFPDPENGMNPDNRPTQDETQFFIDFAEANNIHLSANFHGGAEVVSYPWDTWSRRAADDSWWIEKAREYADLCQVNGPDNYFTDLENGITHGWDWFEVDGGRQDLMNYYVRAREWTIELSSSKLVNSADLPTFWQANREALLTYMEEAMFGFHGQVVDCVTGEPLGAEIIMENHDVDNSSVFSDSLSGYFFRFLDDGQYNAMIVAEGYETLSLPLDIEDKTLTRMNLELCPESTSTTEFTKDELTVTVNEGQLIINGSLSDKVNRIELYDTTGRIIHTQQSPSNGVKLSLNSGIYILHLTVDNRQGTFVITK